MKDEKVAAPRSAGKVVGGPQPFQTDVDVLKFATRFLRDRARGFKKDIDICLTGRRNADGNLTHAYMPALGLCFGFLDLLSGLNAGTLRSQGVDEFREYVKTYMPPGRYDDYALKILYVGFRHKIAHLSHPYLVLDTATEPKRIGGERKRVNWIIYAATRKQPLALERLPDEKPISRHVTPWPVPYDHRLRVCIPVIARDARRSIWGPNGYLQTLRAEAESRHKFRKCMRDFYST